MSNIFHRLAGALAALPLAAASAMIAQGADRGGIASVRVECSAFARTSDTLWTVTKATIVPAGMKEYVAGQIALPTGVTIEPHLYQPNGVDLVDVLNRKCKK